MKSTHYLIILLVLFFIGVASLLEGWYYKHNLFGREYILTAFEIIIYIGAIVVLIIEVYQKVKSLMLSFWSKLKSITIR